MPVRVQQQLLKHFVAGMTARTAARSVGVQAKTAMIFFHRLRQLVVSKQESFLLSIEINAEEIYSKEDRKGRCRRRAAAQVPIFGLLARGGKIHTAIIPDANAKTFIPIFQESVIPDSIIYTNSSHAYNVLNVSEFHYVCLKPCKTVLSAGGYHIQETENFWNESRRYLRRFNGITKTSFYWYLKECEWRFNGSEHRALSQQLQCWYESVLNKA